MPLAVMVTPAARHDSIPARDQLFRLRLAHPDLTAAWADFAYGGTLVDWSHTFLGITLKTVPRRKDQDGFAVLAKRWRVERAISWITRAGRNVRVDADCWTMQGVGRGSMMERFQPNARSWCHRDSARRRPQERW